MPFQKAENLVLEFLGRGPRSRSEIEKRLGEEMDVAMLKEAIWRLLDRSEVEITRDNKLRKARLQTA